MKRAKAILKVTLWALAALAAVFILLEGYQCVRYSPEYVYRELFMDLGTPYDFRVLPERVLAASPEPFRFGENLGAEEEVRQVFESNPAVGALDAFLERTGTQAFLVIQDDTILYERYFLDHARDSVVTSYSVAKSFDSALIGIAISEGYIHSVDDAITDYIPELAERDPRFVDISIRHLLMMASGLRYDTDRLFLPEDDNLTYGFDDLRHLALTETEVEELPGVTFLYNNYNPLLLGLILERATGVPVTTYLQEKLWTPLGMEYAGSWSLDSEESGFEKMESGLNARAVDFAKLGHLYLHAGNWNGKQLVPEAWVEESTRDNGLMDQPNPFYGLMWWGWNCGAGGRDFFAMGNYGQFIYVSPEKDLLIVRNGERYGLEGESEAWAEIFCQFAQDFP